MENQNYFNTKKKKIFDFCLGFVITPILLYLISCIHGSFFYRYGINPDIFDISCLILYLIALILFFQKRKFISIGMIVAIPCIVCFWIIVFVSQIR